MNHEFVRRILKCRDNESITNNLRRKRTAIEKILYKKKISQDDFRNALISIGLCDGDNLIVHCAWREFFNYESTPNSVIDIILDIIGSGSNLAMPCYGLDDTVFDVYKTPSAAGVLSEVFRTEYDVVRSNCSHFSMGVLGPRAYELTKAQIDCKSGFDELATYSQMLSLPVCKVLFLGLGKYPLQITQMHVEEYRLREKYSWCNDLFSEEYDALLLNTPTCGQQIQRTMIKRKSGLPNKKNRHLIYKQLQRYKRVKLSNIDLVLVDGEDSKLSIDKCIAGKKMFSK